MHVLVHFSCVSRERRAEISIYAHVIEMQRCECSLTDPLPTMYICHIHIYSVTQTKALLASSAYCVASFKNTNEPGTTQDSDSYASKLH